MATMSKTPVYFHREQKENETNSQTPWLFSSPPTNCIYLATWNLSDIPAMGGRILQVQDWLFRINSVPFLPAHSKKVYHLFNCILLHATGQTKVVVYRLTKKSLSRPATAITSPTCSKSASPSRFKAFIKQFQNHCDTSFCPAYSLDYNKNSVNRSKKLPSEITM